MDKRESNAMDFDMEALVAKAVSGGLKQLLVQYEQLVQRLDPAQRGLFTDRYFLACINRLDVGAPAAALWTLAVKWHNYRNLSLVGYDFPPPEAEGLLQLLTTLRDRLDCQLSDHCFVLPRFAPADERSIIGCWSGVFLASYSVLNQHETARISDSVGAKDPAEYCHKLLRLSMYYPFEADRFDIDLAAVIAAKIPAYAKVLLVMWLANMPRYNATQFHRQRLQGAMIAIERLSRQTPNWMDPYFHLLAEWLMSAVFRLAYIHEDTLPELSCYGDFLSNQMKRLLPEFAEYRRGASRRFDPPRRIRIGYVSNRFVANAVTFYMANRILHHDPASFEIQLFALGTEQDSMTELLAKNCDRFVRLPNQLDYPAIARAIRDSELDILVYADIGMGIPTYLLASLRLAPIQAALLGHASSTGLPTMDYFFSSELESPQAQAQYREKLIRMPNVGASQILPPGLQAGLASPVSRSRLGIPDSAFIFISCANGMKHIPERDYVWVEILRRIPQAWIVVKPFSPGDIDRNLIARVRRIGELAGAPERIRLIDGVAGHHEVFGLLQLADVQLDTYPFNGWTTTIEACCVNLPTVTQEGAGYRSRLGAGFLRAMGIEEGIASSEEEYIDWAVRFANDPGLCNWVRNRIRATCRQLLFDNRALQIEYENALIRMVRADNEGSIGD